MLVRQQRYGEERALPGKQHIPSLNFSPGAARLRCPSKPGHWHWEL